MTLGPNETLIGQAGSRAQLATPALVLDVDRLDANIAAMAGHARSHSYLLRPTMKIHKSVEIARRQMAAGSAVGVCCATLAEAEAMVDGGISSVLLFTSVTTPVKIRRVGALNARSEDLIVAVDSSDNVAQLAAVAKEYGRELQLLVDVEVGGGRTGVATLEAALALARLIADTDGVAFAGVQAYVGRHQATVDYNQRRSATVRYYEPLESLLPALVDEGLKPRIVSGGGTGTHAFEAELGMLTEVQVGSYVFMDVSYRDAVMRLDQPHPFQPALFVATTVISAAQPGFVVTDVGVKEIDGYHTSLKPEIARGAPADARYSIIGDDIGRIDLADTAGRLAERDRLELLPPHCWHTASMYRVYHVVQGDKLVDIWPLAALVNE